jgi:hypothetical protein
MIDLKRLIDVLAAILALLAVILRAIDKILEVLCPNCPPDE